MAWFVKTTLGNMTQQTKHATYTEALKALQSFEKHYEQAPTENISIEIQFRVGPQAAIKAAQERKAKEA